MQRLRWLDGLRGIACLGVFTHHFILTFFPAMYYGDSQCAHLNGEFETKIA